MCVSWDKGKRKDQKTRATIKWICDDVDDRYYNINMNNYRIVWSARVSAEKNQKGEGSERASEIMCEKLFGMNRNHINSDQIGMNIYVYVCGTYMWLTFGALYLYVSIFVRTLIIYKSMKIYECLTTAPFRSHLSPSPPPPAVAQNENR